MTAHRRGVLSPSTLTAAKLERLLERYTGQRSALPTLANGRPANRLNFAGLEQRDVITGLLDYAAISPAHAQRLDELYTACALHPLGDRCDLDALKRQP